MLERALRALLEQDPETRERVARELDGRVVRVRVTRPEIELALAFVDDRVEVLRRHDGGVDLTVTGSLAALRSLQRSTDALHDGRVRIDGDLAVARALRETIAGFDLDLEALVEPLLGGTLARRLARAGRDLGGWSARTRSRFGADLGDYLREESELLARTEEIEPWSEAVDELRAATDRLEARLVRLERREKGA